MTEQRPPDRPLLLEPSEYGCAEWPMGGTLLVWQAIGYATGMDPNPYKSPERADLAPPRIPDRLDDRHRTVIYLLGVLVCAVAVALMGFVLYFIG